MTRVEMADGWLAHVREAEQVFLDEELGPDILDDARRYCPVDTGRLQRALDHQVLGGGGNVPELQVGAFPDADGPIEYAAAVERGFHGEELVREHMRRSPNGGEHTVREHTRHGNTPEQAYLRPALYQERH